MDRNAKLILAACAALFVFWVVLTPKLYPPPKPVPGATNNVATSTATNAPNAPSLTAATPTPTTPAAPATNSVASLVPPPGAPAETLVVTNGTTRYTFTSQGGGLKMVEFDGARYPESIARSGQKLSTNRPAALNRHAPQPVLALLNAPELEGDGQYKLTRYTRTVPPPTNTPNAAPRTVEGVRAEKLLASQVRLVKEFDFGTNYLLAARFRVENGSPQPLAVPATEWSLGAATPENSQDKGEMVGFLWYDGETTHEFNQAWFDNKSFFGCGPASPRAEYRATTGGAAARVRWVTAFSQFFFLTAMPQEPGIDVTGRRFALPVPTAAEQAANRLALTNQSAFAVALVQPGTNVAPGAAAERAFTLYAGPKEMRVVERVGPQFGGDLDDHMLYPHTWAIFSIFSRALLLAMNALNSIGLSYALAIIVITVLLKLLFWPLTQASTRSMKRMQELAPQMKALQEKYKPEPEKLQKKMMEFYRENKVNPMSGCLPMLVQIPVFIGFFTMVRSAIELRGAEFLWATDLSRPDTVAVLPIFNFIPIWPFTWLHNFPVNPLSVLMGVTMLIQTRLTPMAPGMDPMQQKMLRYMPLFFLVILYNYSAGLTLYWTVQNILTIAQTMLTRTKDKPATPPAAAAAPAKAAVSAPVARKRK